MESDSTPSTSNFSDYQRNGEQNIPSPLATFAVGYADGVITAAHSPSADNLAHMPNNFTLFYKIFTAF